MANRNNGKKVLDEFQENRKKVIEIIIVVIFAAVVVNIASSVIYTNCIDPTSDFNGHYFTGSIISLALVFGLCLNLLKPFTVKKRICIILPIQLKGKNGEANPIILPIKSYKPAEHASKSFSKYFTVGDKNAKKNNFMASFEELTTKSDFNEENVARSTLFSLMQYVVLKILKNYGDHTLTNTANFTQYHELHANLKEQKTDTKTLLNANFFLEHADSIENIFIPENMELEANKEILKIVSYHGDISMKILPHWINAKSEARNLSIIARKLNYKNSQELKFDNNIFLLKIPVEVSLSAKIDLSCNKTSDYFIEWLEGLYELLEKSDWDFFTEGEKERMIVEIYKKTITQNDQIK